MAALVSATPSHQPQAGRKRREMDTIEHRDDEAISALVTALLDDWKAVHQTAFKPGGLLSASLIHTIIVRAREIIMAEPMLVPVEAPVNICGDIHGQIHDLIDIFRIGGAPPAKRYLFLGDYVDRGKHGIEVITLLLGLKVLYPGHIYVLRGNHEVKGVNRQYGFFDECKRRCDVAMYNKFTNVFNVLPIAALVDERALCMHGGLSQELERAPAGQALDLIRQLKRPVDPSDADSGLIIDLLWADPDTGHMGWADSDRGVSHTFGADVVREFLDREDLDIVIRAHQVMEKGYDFFADRRLVTVFSASNYCGEFTNCGAVLMMDENLVCKFHILKPQYKMTLRPRGAGAML